MSTLKPPFHSVTEELLYSILLKLPDVQYLTADDINSVAKLNDLVLDGDFLTSSSVSTVVEGIKGNVPAAGDTLEKLYNIISGLGNLKSQDIDTLAELNAVLTDADLVSTTDLANAMGTVWGVDGNSFGEGKRLGTLDEFPISFVTRNIVRGLIHEHGQFVMGNNARLPGFETYMLQILGDENNNGLAITGGTFFEHGQYVFNLGKVGFSNVFQFRVNTYVASLGGFDFTISANNPNASIEIGDSTFGGTRPEMIRLTAAGYAQTGILIFPNNYNMSFGYRYLLEGTNNGQQGRNVSAFHGQINWSTDDGYPDYNQAHVYAAESLVTNHRMDGFFSNVSSATAATEVYAFRSVGSKNFLDGDGMVHFLPVLKITTDDEPHNTAINDLLNGDAVLSSALMLTPRGSGRTGLIISPAHANAAGLFIGPQQSLTTGHYDGYLAWIQFSTGGSNMTGGTDKAMLLIRKHNSLLNGFDHLGPFIRLEENIGSTGGFIEAYKQNDEDGSLWLKFSVDKDGIISLAKLYFDPPSIPRVGRLYFNGEDFKIITPLGVVKTVVVT